MNSTTASSKSNSQGNKGNKERVTSQANGKEFYIPHKPVIRENAKGTKIANSVSCFSQIRLSNTSLNECLKTGSALQNLLWSVLVRNRFFPEVFLQVSTKEEYRDVLRFNWIKDKDPKQTDKLRFTRTLFGLV